MEKERIERIQKMESKLDDVTPKINAFEQSLNNMESVYENMKILSEYYSKDWKKDYEADEEGKIPKELKRGVLGQDTLYNLFEKYSEIADLVSMFTPELLSFPILTEYFKEAPDDFLHNPAKKGLSSLL